MIEAARRKTAARKKLYQDRRYIEAIGFLQSKGYLTGERALPSPTTALDLSDVLWVAKTLEPRVLEVLPAALLHFPSAFKNSEILPKELAEIVRAIERGETAAGNYRGIRIADMARWAKLAPRDRRVKPIGERRIMKSFRLTPGAIARLKELATETNSTETEVLSRLIGG